MMEYPEMRRLVSQLCVHNFIDASTDAYAAIVFSRKVYIRLLTSKSRVAPLPKLSIPCIELMAATICTQGKFGDLLQKFFLE